MWRKTSNARLIHLFRLLGIVTQSRTLFNMPIEWSASSILVCSPSAPMVRGRYRPESCGRLLNSAKGADPLLGPKKLYVCKSGSYKSTWEDACGVWAVSFLLESGILPISQIANLHESNVRRIMAIVDISPTCRPKFALASTVEFGIFAF